MEHACVTSTLLAPDIVEAILEGMQGSGLNLARALEPFAAEWADRPNHFAPVG
jgi:hypothetical protein